MHLKKFKLPHDYQICPIMLMVVHALRIGAAPETSIDQLCANMAQRQNKEIIWKTPDNPIFCQGRNENLGLFVDKQASRDELDLALKEAIDAAKTIQKRKAKK